MQKCKTPYTPISISNPLCVGDVKCHPAIQAFLAPGGLPGRRMQTGTVRQAVGEMVQTRHSLPPRTRPRPRSRPPTRRWRTRSCSSLRGRAPRGGSGGCRRKARAWQQSLLQQQGPRLRAGWDWEERPGIARAPVVCRRGRGRRAYVWVLGQVEPQHTHSTHARTHARTLAGGPLGGAGADQRAKE